MDTCILREFIEFNKYYHFKMISTCTSALICRTSSLLHSYGWRNDFFCHSCSIIISKDLEIILTCTRQSLQCLSGFSLNIWIRYREKLVPKNYHIQQIKEQTEITAMYGASQSKTYSQTCIRREKMQTAQCSCRVCAAQSFSLFLREAE